MTIILGKSCQEHISHIKQLDVFVPQLLSTAFGAVHKVALASAARRKLSAKNVKLFACQSNIIRVAAACPKTNLAN